MLPRASCACVLLMAFGTSCGGKATVDRARGNPVEPVPPSASSPQAPDGSIAREEPHDDPIPDPSLSDRLLMFVQDGEALSLAEVDLASGTLSSELVALPHAASSVARAQAWGTDIVHFVLADGTQSLEIRGNTWTTLAKALAGEVLTLKVSTTDSLIWTTLSVAKTPGAKKRVSAFVLERSPELKGRQLFAEREIDPHTGVPALQAFSPIGLYFRDTQGLMLQRSNAATPSLLVADASRSLDIKWAFEASILLFRNDSGALEWRTPDGNLIDVPGTAANHRHISGRIQLFDGRLSLLEDRKVRFIQPLTGVSSASNIVAVQDSDPSLVLAHESERWFFADTRGERASYTPALRTPCSQKAETTPLQSSMARWNA